MPLWITTGCIARNCSGTTLVYSVGHASITSESDPAKAAKFALGALRLRLHLLRCHNLEGNRAIDEHLMQAYHYVLSTAAASRSDRLVRQVLAMWCDIPRKHIKTRLLRAVLSLPGCLWVFGKLK